MKYSLFYVGILPIVSDNFDRWGCILYIRLLKKSILRYAKILYLDIYELLMVNYVALTEKIQVLNLNLISKPG